MLEKQRECSTRFLKMLPKLAPVLTNRSTTTYDKHVTEETCKSKWAMSGYSKGHKEEQETMVSFPPRLFPKRSSPGHPRASVIMCVHALLLTTMF